LLFLWFGLFLMQGSHFTKIGINFCQGGGVSQNLTIFRVSGGGIGLESRRKLKNRKGRSRGPGEASFQEGYMSRRIVMGWERGPNMGGLPKNTQSWKITTIQFRGLGKEFGEGPQEKHQRMKIENPLPGPQKGFSGVLRSVTDFPVQVSLKKRSQRGLFVLWHLTAGHRRSARRTPQTDGGR